MKKTRLLCITLCFCIWLCGCTLGDSAETTVSDTTVFVTTMEDKGPEIPKKDTYTVPARREKDGKIQWEYTYSPDGLSMSMTDYTEETPITYTVFFDEGGKPLRKEWTVTVNDTRSEKWRDDYDEFDSEGRITLERRYCEGQIQNAYAYTYDADGRMETQTSRNVKQENITYRFLYDEMGTHVATRFKKYNGEAGYYHEQKTCTYDSSGRIVKEEASSYTVLYDRIYDGEYLTQEKVTHCSGDYSWSYYYGFFYEDGCLIKKDCSFDGVKTDTEYYCETEFLHYYDAINWIFRERLP